MNAHHTIGTVNSVAKIPAGAPASRLATKIAGKKEAKYSLAPIRTNISWIDAAPPIASTAATNADGDHGLTFWIRLRMTRPRVLLAREQTTGVQLETEVSSGHPVVSRGWRLALQDNP